MCERVCVCETRESEVKKKKEAFCKLESVNCLTLTMDAFKVQGLFSLYYDHLIPKTQ